MCNDDVSGWECDYGQDGSCRWTLPTGRGTTRMRTRTRTTASRGGVAEAGGGGGRRLQRRGGGRMRPRPQPQGAARMDSSSVVVVLSRNSGSSMPMGEGGETTCLCVERQRHSQFLLLRRVLVHVPSPSPTIPPHDAHPSRGWDPRDACGRCRRRPSNVLPLLVVVLALVVVALVVHRASHGIVVVVYPARRVPRAGHTRDKRHTADIVPPPRRIAYVAVLPSVSVDMLASCEYLPQEVGRGAGEGGRLTFERRS